jgi:hypothetical protein
MKYPDLFDRLEKKIRKSHSDKTGKCHNCGKVDKISIGEQCPRCYPKTLLTCSGCGFHCQILTEGRRSTFALKCPIMNYKGKWTAEHFNNGKEG